MTDTLRPPSLHLHVPRDGGRASGGLGGRPGTGAARDCLAWSSSSTPTMRRRRFKMRRTKKAPGERERPENGLLGRRPGLRSASKEYLQLPSIEITPSSDEDAPWSNCSTPSASPRRKRFLLRKWLKVRERKELGSESSQHSSQQSSHDDDSTRLLSPFIREESRTDSGTDKYSTASNSHCSSPTCSPVLQSHCRSPRAASLEAEVMVEKSAEPCDTPKSPSIPEQLVSRSYSTQSTRSTSKISKYDRINLIKKSQSWYNVLSPTYKQRNEDFRKLFKQLPDTERLIVDYSCALQRDILLQGRLYLSENWICFYSNIFRWETLLTVRLKDICSMTKEKTARLIPNAIQVCTDTEKHFFTSFGARDRTYMMMFRLWQNALLDKPLCPKELWHFVHQCYGNELGLTSDDEDYVPPDDDFNTMGYCEEIPAEETEVSNDTLSKSSGENKPDSSPPSHKRSITQSTLNSTTPPSSTDMPLSFDIGPEEYTDCLADSELLPLLAEDRKCESAGDQMGAVPSPSLDFNDNEDIPTELSDSSDTEDAEAEVQAFHDDLNGRQYINEVYKFSVDKMYAFLFTESQFMTDFMEQRRFSDVAFQPWKKEEAGNQTREIVYTVSLSNPLAPKTATVSETQTLYKASQESECYIIDAEVVTHDVPYHDYFYTLNRYTLTRVAKNKCRLRVSTELRYRKQPWGLVKGFIEKNFWSGLEENFRILELELAKAEDILLETHGSSPKAKALKSSTLRRRKRPLPHLRTAHLEESLRPVATPTDEEVIQRIRHVAGSTQTRHAPEHAHGGGAFCSMSKLLLIVSFVICISLVLLVFLNMMLFYKLWMLEYSAQTLRTWQGLRLDDRLPKTQVEWAQLLESQQRVHEAELQKWREIIKSAVLLLDQMKNSLLSLQRGVGLKDYGADSGEKRTRYH
ncbi:protein Aster-B isoform X4 [Electrophorus electricus]|uniref:protein Aster-B isoform X4 n=1 Tax=Electrophorus electricus TaxID=8005 RepID=UPI0015CFFE2D|nr:protein Aster-B isoform X4 [Electrophorus electricus]